MLCIYSAVIEASINLFFSFFSFYVNFFSETSFEGCKQSDSRQILQYLNSNPFKKSALQNFEFKFEFNGYLQFEIDVARF